MAAALGGKTAVYRAIVVDGDYVGSIWIRQRDDVACRDSDIASQRVLEKNGFQLEGRTRYSVWKDGNLYDSVIYGLVDEKRAER